VPTDLTSPIVNITTDGSVQPLFSLTAVAGVYVLHMDVAPLQGGDTIRIACTAKVLSGGATRNVFDPVVISGVQVEPDINFRSQTVVAPQGCTFTIERTAGGDRTFSYRIERISGCEVVASGTQPISTTHTLLTSSKNATFVLITDHGNMAGGDTITLRTLQATVSGGVLRVDDLLTLTGAQNDANGEMYRQSLAEPSIYSYRATVTKGGGANHDMAWAVCSVGS
jgi:hypothetical protein